MDTKTYILELIAEVRGQSDAVMQGLTDEQLNWAPAGTANPISAILIHMLGAEDDFIQAALQHKPPLWEEQEWSRKIGVRIPPMPGRGWNEFTNDKVRGDVVQAYQQNVRATTDAYLAKLTNEDLERKAYLFGSELSIAGVFRTLIVHSAGHVGEIAAIKGFQGVKGYPY